jgi:hypothetical protein
VQQLEQPWLVSYDAVQEIVDLYRDTARLRYGLNYTARQRIEGCSSALVSRFREERPSAVSMQAVTKPVWLPDPASILGSRGIVWAFVPKRE